MTRSGPSPLPPLLEIDGNRYSRDSLPADVQDLVLQLQRADTVLTHWRRDVLVMRTARNDLRQRLGAGLAGLPNQSMAPTSMEPTSMEPTSKGPTPAPTPTPSTEPACEPPAARPGAVRRAKDRVKGLFRRFGGGRED